MKLFAKAINIKISILDGWLSSNTPVNFKEF